MFGNNRNSQFFTNNQSHDQFEECRKKDNI